MRVVDHFRKEFAWPWSNRLSGELSTLTRAFTEYARRLRKR
jgi:hypothetical protein